MSAQLNVSELSRLTGSTRETVIRKISRLPFTPGKQGARLYDSRDALRAVMVGHGLTESRQDILAKVKTEQIELDMEVSRRKRIPLEDVEEHNEVVFQNIAGIIKGNEGKVLTPAVIQEIFAELRRMGEVLADYRRTRELAPAGEDDDVTMDDPML